MDFEEAVEHYYSQKMDGSMSLGDIRAELKSRHNFRDEHVKEICAQISDRELDELTKDKKPFFSFLDHVVFSYIMILCALAVITFCIIFLIRLYAIDPELRSSSYAHIAPYAFIGGAVTLIGKHAVKIRRSKRTNL